MSDGTYELHDLDNDPRESNNVARAHEDKAQAMAAKILAFRKTNAQRQEVNFSRIDSAREGLSKEEKEELQKKLRALGYVQ